MTPDISAKMNTPHRLLAFRVATPPHDVSSSQTRMLQMLNVEGKARKGKGKDEGGQGEGEKERKKTRNTQGEGGRKRRKRGD